MKFGSGANCCEMLLGAISVSNNYLIIIAGNAQSALIVALLMLAEIASSELISHPTSRIFSPSALLNLLVELESNVNPGHAVMSGYQGFYLSGQIFVGPNIQPVGR